MIEAAHATFIQSGVAISVATCGPARVCHLVRGIGCKLVGERVAVFVPLPASGGLLADVAANGRIAVVFCQPSTNRTLQLKGRDACTLAAAPIDAAIRARQLDAFVLEVAPEGFPEAMVRPRFDYPPEQVVTLAFTPCEAYTQTPGPDAGAPLAL